MIASRVSGHGIRQLSLTSSSILQRVRPVTYLVSGGQTFNPSSLPLRFQTLNGISGKIGRLYATDAPASSSTPASKPKASTTRSVKRRSTSTSKGKKSTTAKKSTVKKSKRKVKKVAKKPKVRKPKKELTPEEKRKVQLRELKLKALKTPHGLPSTAWSVLSAEVTKDSKALVTGVKEASVKYKNLVPEEKEHYNHVAHENKTKNDAAYKAWVESHTPDQIRVANNARSQLRRLTGRSRQWSKIQDDRQVKRPVTPKLLFNTDRWASGDFNGMKITEVPQLLKREWDALSSQDKKAYEDTYKTARAKYQQDRAVVYGVKTRSTKKRATTS